MLSGTMPQNSVYYVLGPVTWSFNDLQHQDKSTNNFLEYSMYQFAPTNVITIAMSSHEKKLELINWTDLLFPCCRWEFSLKRVTSPPTRILVLLIHQH